MFPRPRLLDPGASEGSGSDSRAAPAEPARATPPSTPPSTRPAEYSGDSTRTSMKMLRFRTDSRDRTTPDAVTAEVESWKPGVKIADKYEVVEKIGEGGFGSVYKVRHVHRKKLYALKAPHADFCRDQVFRRRFEREIQALERFVHPDVVTIRDSGLTAAGIPYYTMDFIEGESLRQVLRREERLQLKRAVRIARAVLEVLQVAHENQIVHRDIKPDNILLTREGKREVVKVLDFGVAKLLDLVGKTATLTRGLRVGTPKYMSPEQVAGDPVDARSDVFAVGILLYESVTGQHPFDVEGDPVRTAAAIIGREPSPPRELRPEVPRDFSDAILRMLQKKPRRRPRSAAEALRILPEMSTSSGRSTAAETPDRVHAGARRARVDSLVLCRMTPEGLRRDILIFKSEVTLGRAGSGPHGRNDLVLRRLPCRSRKRDPENWRKNLTISQRAATIRLERSSIVIEPSPTDRGYGIAVGGLPSRDPVRVQSDRFHLSLGDRALELDGLRVLRNTRKAPLGLDFLPPLDSPPGAPAEVDEAIGYSNPDCVVDFVRLTRADNHRTHAYYLVYRRLSLGSGTPSGIRLEDGGVRERHASLIVEGGEVFLAAGDGEVDVLPDPGERERGEGWLDRERIRIPRDTLYPITPGMYIFLGEAKIRVDELTESVFKDV